MARRGVLRPTNSEAVRLARSLVRTARYGALAVLQPQGGWPLASRVGVATNPAGCPLILISALAAHTGALLADPRCSLLLGEPGKGDPLAHPRITLTCRAVQLVRGSSEHAEAERRYLNRHPKAKLYVGLGDFSFFRLEPEGVSLNGGFGRAFAIERGDLVIGGNAVEALAGVEQPALDHMNRDHAEAVTLIARHFAAGRGAGWALTGIDVEGLDLARGDEVRRAWFPAPLANADELRPLLVRMAQQARAALGTT